MLQMIIAYHNPSDGKWLLSLAGGPSAKLLQPSCGMQRAKQQAQQCQGPNDEGLQGADRSRSYSLPLAGLEISKGT